MVYWIGSKNQVHTTNSSWRALTASTWLMMTDTDCVVDSSPGHWLAACCWSFWSCSAECPDNWLFLGALPGNSQCLCVGLRIGRCNTHSWGICKGILTFIFDPVWQPGGMCLLGHIIHVYALYIFLYIKYLNRAHIFPSANHPGLVQYECHSVQHGPSFHCLSV